MGILCLLWLFPFQVRFEQSKAHGPPDGSPIEQPTRLNRGNRDSVILAFIHRIY